MVVVVVAHVTASILEDGRNKSAALLVAIPFGPFESEKVFLPC